MENNRDVVAESTIVEAHSTFCTLSTLQNTLLIHNCVFIFSASDKIILPYDSRPVTNTLYVIIPGAHLMLYILG